MRDFHYTLNVLVKAFLNNTLVHNNCYACAVGNMIAAGQQFSFERLLSTYNNNQAWLLKWSELPSIYDPAIELSSDSQPENWMNVFRDGEIYRDAYNGKAKELIDSTGYSVDELASIEQAFENADHGDSDDAFMFNGLMAVVDVLADIHGIDLKVREEAKALFVKA